MANWYKTCYSFKRVRELLDQGVETPTHCMNIMYALEGCCDELTPDSAEDWVYYDEFRDLKTEIHEEVELMDDTDYSSCKNVVNSYLETMYTLCDYARVWLSM